MRLFQFKYFHIYSTKPEQFQLAMNIFTFIHVFNTIFSFPKLRRKYILVNCNTKVCNTAYVHKRFKDIIQILIIFLYSDNSVHLFSYWLRICPNSARSNAILVCVSFRDNLRFRFSSTAWSNLF